MAKRRKRRGKRYIDRWLRDEHDARLNGVKCEGACHGNFEECCEIQWGEVEM